MNDREDDALHKDADTLEELVKGEGARSVMNTGGGPDGPTTPNCGSAGASEPSQLQRLRDRTFRTFDGTTVTCIDAGYGPEMVPVRDRRFRRWLCQKLQEETGKRPSQATLTASIDSLEMHASRGYVAEVHLRVAVAGGRVYLDLADGRGRFVEVGPDGWKVIDTPPVHFIRSPSMRPLLVPEKGGSIEDFRSLINIADDGDFVLIVAFLLDALRNDGGHPVLVINGGEGTPKTTLVEILRELIDPRWAPLSRLSSTERQLLEGDDGYLRVYDNVFSISARTSDALCRMSTGKPAHPVIINGTGELVMRADLADRSLFVNLAPVADRQRRSLQEI
jgi:putative DNA primase/helicase